MLTKGLNLFRTPWGVIKGFDGSITFESFVKKVSQLGYSGIEMPLIFALEYGKDRMKILNDYNLDLIFIILTDGPFCPGHSNYNGKYIKYPMPNNNKINVSIDIFKQSIEDCFLFDKKPIKINSHSLRDYNTFNEAKQYFDNVLKFEEEIDIPIMHETHRKRFFYSPWICRDFLRDYDNEKLKLVADLSHFTCVAEVDPYNEKLSEVIKYIAPKIKHIHGRIGYDHGPQVSDPRANEWLNYTNGFEKWWDIIFNQWINDNKLIPTFTPEHGPPNYQQTIPYTKQPLANVWDINTWIGQRNKQRYNEMISKLL